jgi:cell division protein FtsI (penicillin-binding protein 3)
VTVRGDARATRWTALRIGIIGLLFAAGFTVVAGRAVQLQVVERDRLGGMARDQYVREIELQPRRGAITDRNGTVLAADGPADSVYFDPQELGPRGETAKVTQKLARALSVDSRALTRKLAKGSRFVWVKRRISPAESDAVHALDLPGVGMVRESRRYYPRRELAGQVLGFVGDDGDGLEGMEVAFDEALKGEPATIPSLRDARGMQLFGDAPAPETVLEGARLELTLEQGLQVAAETALGRAVQESKAASGMAVVLDVKTGEILALANAPTFNPNAPRRGGEMRDRAVLDTFEPGSTMKVFSIAGALEEKVLKAQDAIFCENGTYTVGSHQIHDHHKLGWTGPSRIIITSSNVGAAKIAQRLGREKLQRALLSFGFGERTGVDVLGEPRGSVPLARAAVALANMAFGQGLTATPLQVTTAMAAIANGGMLMKPWLVRRVFDPTSGKVLMQGAPTPVRRAVSPATATLMARWLEEVVSDPMGTGKKAKVPGWRVAGKTGTAQKPDPSTGGYSDKNFASFVGFAPATAPQLAIGVFIDEPKGPDFGGDVAAPVFAEIARSALEMLGTQPSEPLPPAKPAPGAAALAEEGSPALTFAAAKPAPEVEEVESEQAGGTSAVSVPALSGLPLRTAVHALEELDLATDVSGSGRVVGQSPRPGTRVAPGTRVRLTLAPPG